MLQAKLAELQDLVMRLVAERNEWYSRYTGAAAAGVSTVNPDLLPMENHTPLEHQTHTDTEVNAISEEGMNGRHNLRVLT